MIKVSKLKEAVSAYGTPLYVYDLDIIEKQYIELKMKIKLEQQL